MPEYAVYEAFDEVADPSDDIRRRGGQVFLIDGTVLAVLPRENGQKISSDLDMAGKSAPYRLRLASTQKLERLYQEQMRLGAMTNQH